MKISLICATIGRPRVLRELLSSLTRQSHKDFEVLVVDQSPNNDSKLVVDEFFAALDIVYLRSEVGISRARNKGLRAATGDVVGFPDDDCKYYEDTLECVSRVFDTGGATVVLGRIYDRERRRNVMRAWPALETSLAFRQVYLFGSSICVFSRNTKLKMDEDFGVGSVYGCCEDIDYCWRHFGRELRAIPYYPSIQVWHPELNVNVMPIQKVRAYAFGAGGLCAKHSTYGILCLSMAVHFLRFVYGILRFDLKRVRSAVASFYMRLSGVRHYLRRGVRSAQSD